MGLTTWTSTLKMTAVMMTAESAAFGMSAHTGISTANANNTSVAEYTPPMVERTPHAAFSADREKELAVGIECTNDPARLHTPRASISWDASTGLPPAG
jgi:hypothetical protein